MRSASRIVACSEAMARQTREVFPAVGGKVTHVHNGLDLADFAAGQGALAIAGPFVLSVCRQVDKKGIDEGAGAVAPAAFDEAAMSETSSRATTTARR
jgi:hypothetical protein